MKAARHTLLFVYIEIWEQKEAWIKPSRTEDVFNRADGSVLNDET